MYPTLLAVNLPQELDAEGRKPQMGLAINTDR